MNLFQIHQVLMVLATTAAVIVFFAIETLPSLRTGGPRSVGPHRANPLY